MAYQPGTEMGGNFVLVRRLGYGGMGQVYEALDRALGRKVAIKIMSRGALSTSSARERFRQEARALARINCPQIIQIYSLDLEFEPPFLVLEYVNGASLKETLRERKRLPVELSLQIGLEVVRGLRIAYDKGVIHRDINPRNIMLSFEGEVKIGDFGLAKSRVWDLSLTSDGAILGTPLYMSPEQWKSEPVDFRSDIYSLGITLYHLITGSPPFDAESVATVMLKHLSSPLPEATREQPGATGELMKLLRRMTAKDPAHRYSSYSELQQDMQHLLTG
ncbi:MAG: serine/threonine protein kinase [Deltaproteobacteria bacterium]|nr:serine/threonine protein kinase [Deltaproteobacteria bacterium]